ncbi:MAG: prephenate dehydrogenase/arogenate dehydrogenase family protein [Deltaproteobacteria bacterium]|nr:prephenate dehydrogenase/arogenate dehydrogenase family protein [Deltaproteobacteria bacterium]
MKTYHTVALVGVGLIGGSLSRDLLKRKIADEVVGFDTDKKNLAYAVKAGIVSTAGRSLRDTLGRSDLVILATPVLALEERIKSLAEFIPAQTLVIDVGSTKQKIIRLADRFFYDGNFVGCHPMAGDEKSGARASRCDLFDRAPCLIVCGQKTRPAFAGRARVLWKSLGARVIELSLKDHDKYLAACSHLPHVLSFALMSSVGKKISPAALKKIAGQSFKSYTRIAGSNARMWRDIFIANQENTLSQIDEFQTELASLKKAISSGDHKGLFKYMEKAARMWRKM